MNVATTLQFRNAVRKVCKEQNFMLGNSWTNGAPGHFQSPKRHDYGDRTVGFYCNAACDSLAAEIEQELGKHGLTAETRATDCTDDLSCTGGRYIRGTCVLA
jgi:hypothetical protein